MTLPDDQLRRLLDGEIDAGELAGDRVMASIADRVFGVKVDPAVRPVKPRDAAAMGQESGAPAAAQPEMLVEIIPGGGAPLPALDAPPAAVIPPGGRRPWDWLETSATRTRTHGCCGPVLEPCRSRMR